ncbi:MAG: transposase, partial [Lachnospiraceae bacterium]|nr:transposase [Lachnospiraceae bacterium]
ELEKVISELNEKYRLKGEYESIIAQLGDEKGQHVKSLNRYICRQTRKRLHRQHTDNETYFTIKKQGYRYGELNGEHGIFLATKVNRKRIFIPLTDTNVYDRMLDIKLHPQKRKMEIIIPLLINTRRHENYANEIGISLGLWDMVTTSTGNVYGSEFGKIQQEISRFVLKENYQNGRENVSGTQKYAVQKTKMDAALKNYVNMEINRMLAQEKPKVIYMAKLPRNPGMRTAGYRDARQFTKGTGDTHFLRMWKKGFVTERLRWKCQKNGVSIIEVIGKGIGTECSACGQKGTMKGENFRCPACGFEENKKVNGARNALNRGKTGKQLNKQFPQQKDGKTDQKITEK